MLSALVCVRISDYFFCWISENMVFIENVETGNFFAYSIQLLPTQWIVEAGKCWKLFSLFFFLHSRRDKGKTMELKVEGKTMKMMMIRKSCKLTISSVEFTVGVSRECSQSSSLTEMRLHSTLDVLDKMTTLFLVFHSWVLFDVSRVALIATIIIILHHDLVAPANELQRHIMKYHSGKWIMVEWWKRFIHTRNRTIANINKMTLWHYVERKLPNDDSSRRCKVDGNCTN